MLDTPCSEVVWRVLTTQFIHKFPLHFPSLASPCAITFQLESNNFGQQVRVLFVAFRQSDSYQKQLSFFKDTKVMFALKHSMEAQRYTYLLTHLLTYSLTYLLTYSMVQSSSWEANWFAASQEIPRISRNPKVHYHTHKPPPPVPILGQPNPVHIPTSHLLEIHPNIIHPSTRRSPQWSLFLRFPHQDPIYPSPHPYAPHAQSNSFFSILSPAQYWVRSTNHLAPRYAISSILIIKPTYLLTYLLT